MKKYRIRDDRIVSITPLDRFVCAEFADDLICIHNQIPFQTWSKSELLADRDETREFIGKWSLSHCAFIGKTICGFCIAFERRASTSHYPTNCIYMHRMAISSQFRNLGIGVILHCHSLAHAFERGLKHLTPSNEIIIRGQTNDTPKNAKMIQFHKHAGYRFIGKIEYPDRWDWLMEMSVQDFETSMHTSLWKQAAIYRD